MKTGVTQQDDELRIWPWVLIVYPLRPLLHLFYWLLKIKQNPQISTKKLKALHTREVLTEANSCTHCAAIKVTELVSATGFSK